VNRPSLLPVVVLICVIGPRPTFGQPCPSGPGCHGWTANFRAEGVAGPKHAVVSDDGQIYAYGKPMLSTTGFVWNGILRWNGSDWESVAALEGSITALYAGTGSTIYVIGTFSRLGYPPSNAVAAWDGSELTFLGSTMADPPKVLALSPGGGLYLGGGTRTGGPFRTPLVYQSTAGLMRWDGAKWAPSGGWSKAYVDKIVVAHDGTLYASVSNGGFCIARLQTGEDQFVCLGPGRAGSMAVDSDGNLYVAELSGAPEGVPLQRWTDGQQTGPVLEGVREVIGRDGEVWALVARDSLEVLHLRGGTWVATGRPFSGPVSDLSASPGRGVVVAGAIRRGSGPVETIVHLVGDQWNPIRDSTPRLGLTGRLGRMHAMAGGGALVAIEHLDRTRVDSTQLAVFVAGTWTTLGGALHGGWPEGQVRALFADDAEEVFVSGTFRSLNGTNLIGLAHWDGSLWHEMESLPLPFTDGEVLAFTRDANGSLIVVGAGTAGQGFVLRWNNPGWTVLTSVGGSVTTVVAVPDGSLVIGGSFTSPGLHYVARLDKNGLTELGHEFSRPPGALVVHGGELVGLDNTSDLLAGNSSQARRWNGTTWEVMGGRFSGQANEATQLAVDGEDRLYAAGNFRWAGLTDAHGIARWDGSAWAAIPGVSGEMGTLSDYAGRPKDYWALGNRLKMGVGRDGTLYLGFNGSLKYTGGAIASGFSVWHPDGPRRSDLPDENASPYSVYPNPTTGHIQISGSPPPSRVSLYDTLGRRLSIYRWDSAFPDLTIDLSAPAPGVYFLVLESSQGLRTVPVIVR
jgi:Secretion system C-terminal sorting domain